MSHNDLETRATAPAVAERMSTDVLMKKTSQIVGDSKLLKQISRQRILNLLHTHKVLSRAEIARQTGLTRSTVTQHTTDLITEGLVAEGSNPNTHVSIGRPGVPVALAPDGASFIGADIAIERLSIVKLNLAGTVVDQIEEPIGSKLKPEAVLSRLADLITQINENGSSSPEKLRGIGVTAPAIFSGDGMLLVAPRLGWSNVPVQRLLAARLPSPLFLDNDANASALGETFHTPFGKSQNLLYVLLDAGIGGGIVINGQLYRGNGGAGEIGHISLSLDGPLCSCGNMGCLEAWVGRDALLNRYEMATGRRVDLEALKMRVTENDESAHKVLNEWAVWLGRGLVGLVNVLNPDRLVIGGALSTLLPHVSDRLNHELNRFSWPPRDPIFVETSQHGAFAAAVGAATLAQHPYFEVP
ncbi:ROK family transcriptional regulator [Caballeronia sordidicola]|uniref:Putative ROK-family transcriptional regulator n=1 Tax=Caballeronia sordidicola TaxID=196367 RepID=A0A242MSQ8_CABSO|nr:ROK family transcriptional regulator [Caballeronia sordidicola]OTP74272.1 putative ROK-family transcriptional regulator [Caballeronia sordidicola]